MFIIDTTSRTPVYLQLKKQIIEFISVGVLSANDQLPSVRSIASTIGVNPNTVSKAYQELEEAGYVYSLKGKGCFIAEHSTEDMIKADKIEEFRQYVNEMKKHNITKEDLLVCIEEVYKEEAL